MLQLAVDQRLEELFEQTTVLDAYLARFRDGVVLADSLFFEPKAGEPPIVALLSQLLYQHFYCFLPEPSKNEQDAVEIADPEGFLGRLKLANKSTEFWSPVWAIHSETFQGQPVVFSGEIVHLADPSEVEKTLDEDGNPTGWATVKFKSERVAKDMGFYFVYGQTPVDAFDRTVVTRLYFNLGPAGARNWIELVSSRFNHAQVPFTLKCPLNPMAFLRTDSCVLYVPRRYFSFAWQVVSEFLPELASLLRPSTPMFALPIKSGVSIADDPGNGESFGQHRMRLVARGLSREDAMNSSNLTQKRSAVSDEFAMAGLDLDAPHLNAGATAPRLEFSEVDL